MTGSRARVRRRTAARRVVEVRSYSLHPGTGAELDRLFREQALPMLRRWAVDVVAYGRSLHDPDAYFLVRAYDDLGHRTRSQDAFYGSDEWRQGPREPILALIDSYTDVVLELDDATIEALRVVPDTTAPD